jgi:hypothetical protein
MSPIALLLPLSNEAIQRGSTGHHGCSASTQIWIRRGVGPGLLSHAGDFGKTLEQHA